MDYQALAEQFLSSGSFMRDAPQRRIDESMRGENFVLFFIASRGTSVVPGDISLAMDVSTARVAAALNRLEDKGWITRRIDPNDRRRVLVELTPAGSQVAQQHRQQVLGHTVRMLELLGEHDATELVRIWQRLRELAPSMGPLT